MPDSHKVVWVVKVVQKDPKDNELDFESFVFWVFLHDSNNSKDLL